MSRPFRSVEIGRRRAVLETETSRFWKVYVSGKLAPVYAWGASIRPHNVRQLLERLHECDLAASRPRWVRKLEAVR